MPQAHDDSGQVFVSTLVAVLRPPQAMCPLRNNRLVISAEVCERVHDGHHLAAELGKAILNAGRILAIVMAKDQPIILHLPQVSVSTF